MHEHAPPHRRLRHVAQGDLELVQRAPADGFRRPGAGPPESSRATSAACGWPQSAIPASASGMASPAIARNAPPSSGTIPAGRLAAACLHDHVHEQPRLVPVVRRDGLVLGGQPLPGVRAEPGHAGVLAPDGHRAVPRLPGDVQGDGPENRPATASTPAANSRKAPPTAACGTRAASHGAAAMSAIAGGSQATASTRSAAVPAAGRASAPNTDSASIAPSGVRATNPPGDRPGPVTAAWKAASARTVLPTWPARSTRSAAGPPAAVKHRSHEVRQLDRAVLLAEFMQHRHALLAWFARDAKRHRGRAQPGVHHPLRQVAVEFRLAGPVRRRASSATPGAALALLAVTGPGRRGARSPTPRQAPARPSRCAASLTAARCRAPGTPAPPRRDGARRWSSARGCPPSTGRAPGREPGDGGQRCPGEVGG